MEANFVEQVRNFAHTKHSKTYNPSPSIKDECLLLPIFIAVPRPDGLEVTETLLWRLGDSTWDPKAVAGRVRQDLALPQDTEREIETQIVHALQSYKVQADLVGEKLVHFEFYVRREAYVFRDEMEWDIACPANTAHGYAAQVCKDLDLDLAWYDAITKYVNMRIEETVHDLKACPEIVELLPPIKCGIKSQSLIELPRLEQYQADKDIEKRRMEDRVARISNFKQQKQ